MFPLLKKHHKTTTHSKDITSYNNKSQLGPIRYKKKINNSKSSFSLLLSKNKSIKSLLKINNDKLLLNDLSLVDYNKKINELSDNKLKTDNNISDKKKFNNNNFNSIYNNSELLFNLLFEKIKVSFINLNKLIINKTGKNIKIILKKFKDLINENPKIFNFIKNNKYISKIQVNIFINNNNIHFKSEFIKKYIVKMIVIINDIKVHFEDKIIVSYKNSNLKELYQSIDFKYLLNNVIDHIYNIIFNKISNTQETDNNKQCKIKLLYNKYLNLKNKYKSLSDEVNKLNFLLYRNQMERSRIKINVRKFITKLKSKNSITEELNNKSNKSHTIIFNKNYNKLLVTKNSLPNADSITLKKNNLEKELKILKFNKKIFKAKAFNDIYDYLKYNFINKNNNSIIYYIKILSVFNNNLTFQNCLIFNNEYFNDDIINYIIDYFKLKVYKNNVESNPTYKRKNNLEEAKKMNIFLGFKLKTYLNLKKNIIKEYIYNNNNSHNTITNNESNLITINKQKINTDNNTFKSNNKTIMFIYNLFDKIKLIVTKDNTYQSLLNYYIGNYFLQDLTVLFDYRYEDIDSLDILISNSLLYNFLIKYNINNF